MLHNRATTLSQKQVYPPSVQNIECHCFACDPPPPDARLSYVPCMRQIALQKIAQQRAQTPSQGKSISSRTTQPNSALRTPTAKPPSRLQASLQHRNMSTQPARRPPFSASRDTSSMKIECHCRACDPSFPGPRMNYTTCKKSLNLKPSTPSNVQNPTIWNTPDMKPQKVSLFTVQAPSSSCFSGMSMAATAPKTMVTVLQERKTNAVTSPSTIEKTSTDFKTKIPIAVFTPSKTGTPKRSTPLNLNETFSLEDDVVMTPPPSKPPIGLGFLDASPQPTDPANCNCPGCKPEAMATWGITWTYRPCIKRLMTVATAPRKAPPASVLKATAMTANGRTTKSVTFAKRLQFTSPSK